MSELAKVSPRRKPSSRVGYSVAGEAGREAIAQFNAAAAQGAVKIREARVFLAVLSLTALYSRLEERLTHGVIADACGLHPKTVSKALKVLARESVLEYEAGRSWRFSVVRLAGATESHAALLPTESYAAPLLADETESKPPSRLPSTEPHTTPSTEPHTTPTTEKDHREGPPRRTPRESYDSLGAPASRPSHATETETGLDEERELERIDARAELAKLRAAIWGDEAR